MLMGNASKILQTVAANIDRDVINPALSGLFDMVMLTDSLACSPARKKLRVRGVAWSLSRKRPSAPARWSSCSHRQPDRHADHGPKGRATVLRAVSNQSTGNTTQDTGPRTRIAGGAG
jgi:hypothetical protein